MFFSQSVIKSEENQEHKKQQGKPRDGEQQV